MQPDWMNSAACAKDGRDLWYADPSERRQLKEAKRICKQECPVETQCLAYAMAFEANNESPSLRYGIWGATTADQRRQLARKTK